MSRYCNKKIQAMHNFKVERLAESQLKRLSDFPRVSGCFGKRGFYELAHRVYPSVTFSETRTFDLMVLLYSYRVLCASVYRDIKRNLERMPFSDELPYNPYWKYYYKSVSEMGFLPDDDYTKALKKELSKRRELTAHEKRSAYIRRYLWV